LLQVSDYVVDPTTHAKLGFQGSNGSVPTAPIVVKYTPFVSIFSFYLYFFIFLLTCTGRTVDRRNIVNGSADVFPCKVGHFWG